MDHPILISQDLNAFVGESGYRFSFLASGKGFFTCADGTKQPLSSYTFFLRRPGEDVTPEWEPRSYGYTLLVDAALCEQPPLAPLLSPFENTPLVQLPQGVRSPFGTTLFSDMCEIDAQAPLAAQRLIAKWIELMIALREAMAIPPKPQRPEQRLVDAVTCYIKENISRSITLDDIAGALFVSKYHMCHVFKKETGFTVGEIVLRHKIAHADRLIAAGTPAHRASEMVGFNHYSAFFRIYKRFMGCAPTKKLRE